MKDSCLIWIFLACLLLIGSGCEQAPNSAEPPSGDTASSIYEITPEDTTATGEENDLPQAVAATRDAILDAAEAEDFEALQAIIDESPYFNYTFGPDHPGGAVGYWKEYRDREDQPFERLETLLQLEPELRDSLYVWPSWTAIPLDSLSAEEREELVTIMGEEMADDMLEELDYYLGWRTAIDTEGNWVYYVAGD